MTKLTFPKFLINAKLHTYAGAGERAERKLPDDGKEFFYEEGYFQYRDRYYGFNPFAGEEVVWEKEKNGERGKGKRGQEGELKVIWVMNFAVTTISKKATRNMGIRPREAWRSSWERNGFCIEVKKCTFYPIMEGEWG